MPIEFCHLCKTATNMSTTVTPRTIADKDGKKSLGRLEMCYSETICAFHQVNY